MGPPEGGAVLGGLPVQSDDVVLSGDDGVEGREVMVAPAHPVQSHGKQRAPHSPDDKSANHEADPDGSAGESPTRSPTNKPAHAPLPTPLATARFTVMRPVTRSTERSPDPTISSSLTGKSAVANWLIASWASAIGGVADHRVPGRDSPASLATQHFGTWT